MAALARMVSCVQPGGYLDGDKADEVGGVRLVVDKMSVPYLMGATIDNPNAGSACACGDSCN